MNVEKLSSKELEQLKKDIAKREEVLLYEAHLPAIEKTKKIVDLIVANPVLLELFPHARNSCANNSNEDTTRNGYYSDMGYADCNRCWLNEIIQDYKTNEHNDVFYPENQEFIIESIQMNLEKIKK